MIAPSLSCEPISSARAVGISLRGSQPERFHFPWLVRLGRLSSLICPRMRRPGRSCSIPFPIPPVRGDQFLEVLPVDRCRVAVVMEHYLEPETSLLAAPPIETAKPETSSLAIPPIAAPQEAPAPPIEAAEPETSPPAAPADKVGNSVWVAWRGNLADLVGIIRIFSFSFSCAPPPYLYS